MLNADELRAFSELLRSTFVTTGLPEERLQELLLVGIVATLEELTRTSDSTEGAADAVTLLGEAAAHHPSAAVRGHALRALDRLASEGSTGAGAALAIDALYRLAVEENLLAARQAIISHGWQPSRSPLGALFQWFTSLETNQPYPEGHLTDLTQGFFEEASPDLRRRLLATAPSTRMDNWARIVDAIQQGTPEALIAMSEGYPGYTADERALILDQLERLARLGSVPAQETISLLFVRHEDPRARTLASEENYLPEDAQQRALFLFLAEAWQSYESLDFDHHLLVSAYESAGRSLRRRLMEHSRHTGKVEWMRGMGIGVGSGASGGAGSGTDTRWLNDLTDADWEHSIRRLVDGQRYADLWRLAQVAPPIWSAPILDRLSKAGWLPEDPDDQAGFTRLAALAKESLASPLVIRPRKTLHSSATELNSLAIHPAGTLLAGGTGGQSIYLWQLPDGSPRPPLIGPVPVTRALAFSPDGDFLAAASGDHRIRVFRMAGGLVLKALEGHRAMIRSLAIHLDGRTLYSAGFDGTIHIWRFPSGPALKVIRPGPGEIFSMVLAMDGRYLISGGADCLVRVWSLPDGAPAREMAGHLDTITHLATAPNSDLVASAGRDGMIRVWNFTSGGLVRSIENNGGPLTALLLHPDDQVLIGGRSSGEITLWSLSTGRVIGALSGHHNPITGLALSPQSHLLYSADNGADGSPHLQIWDLTAFLTIRLPGDTFHPEQANAGRSDWTTSEKKWLAFAAELARWRQRFDIELGEPGMIEVGEFDIEL